MWAPCAWAQEAHVCNISCCISWLYWISPNLSFRTFYSGEHLLLGWLLGWLAGKVLMIFFDILILAFVLWSFSRRGSRPFWATEVPGETLKTDKAFSYRKLLLSLKKFLLSQEFIAMWGVFSACLLY